MEAFSETQGLALCASARVRVLRLARVVPPPRAQTPFVGADLCGGDGACAGAFPPDRAEVRFVYISSKLTHFCFFVEVVIFHGLMVSLCSTTELGRHSATVTTATATTPGAITYLVLLKLQ